MKIGIIGGTGTMGEVLIKGMLSLKIPRSALSFSGRDPKKIQMVSKKYRIQSLENQPLVARSDVVFVCVKPQEFRTWPSFKKSTKKKVIISVMAGITIQKLKNIFPNCTIVRSMPNLGGHVGKSMTGWCTADKLSLSETNKVKRYLCSFGKETQLAKEDDINKFAAVFGSGPAYLYLLMQLLEEQGVAFGFTMEQSRQMVQQLIKGAFKYLKESQLPPEELIQKVASKGGMTEAALNHLHANRWPATFKKALEKAYKRARELSQ